jgi:hypothetical protein
MGRYATVPAGEMKLSGSLASAVAYIIGSKRAKHYGVELSREEVLNILEVMRHMYEFMRPDPRKVVSVYCMDTDEHTRGWLYQHLTYLPTEIGMLLDWLGTGESSLAFY